MQIYVINLEQSRGRLQQITYYFQRQKLTFERIVAIDAKTMALGQYNVAAKNNENEDEDDEFMSKGEFACFLSHRAAWQQVADGNDKYAAILEDDAFLSSDARHFLNNERWIPKGTDLIKLDTDENSILIGKTKKTHYGRDLAKLKGSSRSAAGYIISKQTAKKLLQDTKNISIPVDEFLFDVETGEAANLKVYQCNPAIIRTTDTPTTINDRKKEAKLAAGTILKQILKTCLCFIPNKIYQIVQFIRTGEKRTTIPFV